MKRKTNSLQTRLYFITAIILLAGLAGAAFVYERSGNISDIERIYQLQNSKMTRHNLQVMGGTANVLADDFCRWFDGLWHGKSLALTLLCITAVVAFGFFFVACRLPSGPDSDRPDPG